MEPRPPREVALRILEALFGSEARRGAGAHHGSTGELSPEPGAGPGAERTYPLTDFQEAAAARLRGIVARRGGAVLADAVGLGKTYVALALIEERLRGGDDVVVAIPAALRGLWRPPLRRLARAVRRPAVRLVSHAQLSRGVAIRAPAGGRLVVVDEAHRFRNPATRRYGALARLMSPVPPSSGGPAPAPDLLLVTATPINNTIEDLYHLVRLFLRDDGLRDAGVPSLRGVFEGPDPAGVRAVVRELVVRRSRGMVDARFGAVGRGRDTTGRAVAPASFPERAPPEIHGYRSPGIRTRVETIGALELAAYGPGAAPLLRLGLLKRLDSSPAALAVSVGRARAFLSAFRDAAAAGRLLRPGDRRVGGDGDPFQLLLLGVVAAPAPPALDLDALIAATDRDLDRLDALLLVGASSAGAASRDHGDRTLDAGLDAKADALVALLRSLEGERVLVFTEYRDTAEAVWRALLPRLRVARIDGGGAWLGPNPAGRRRVVERFAPGANGRREPPDRERVDVLVATDVLAEGVNLQDARHVVSYDLPWNPVRLLQRIGRVDRLGSPHAVVVPHLFVPADGLDAVLGLTRRLRRKLHGIVAALGEERADALLAGLASGRSDGVEAALRQVDRADVDPMESLRTMWLRKPPAPRPAGSPGVSFAVLEPLRDTDVEAVALAAGSDGRCRILELRRDGTVMEPTVATVGFLEAALGQEGLWERATSGAGPPRRVEAVMGSVLAHLRRERVAELAPAPLNPRDAGPRLARRIRRGLADAGSGLDPTMVERAGRILTTLGRPLHPAREDALARLLADLTATGSVGDALPDLLARVERAFLGAAVDRPTGSIQGADHTGPAGTVQALLVLAPPA